MGKYTLEFGVRNVESILFSIFNIKDIYGSCLESESSQELHFKVQ